VHDLADVMCRIQNITPNTTLPPNYTPPLPTTRLQRLQQRAKHSVRLVTSLHRTLPVQLFIEKVGSGVSKVGKLTGAEKVFSKWLPRTSEVEEEVEEVVQSGGSFVKNLFGRGSDRSVIGASGASSTSGMTVIGDSNTDTDVSDGTGSVWTNIKSSVGGVATTLKNRWGAERQSEEVIGIVPPKKEIGKCAV